MDVFSRTVAKPLYNLLRKRARFDLDGRCIRALEQIKYLISRASVLVHFNPDLPLKLYCDSSAYGLGAVLVHRMPNGIEKPIAYTSRTLSRPEESYSQIHKEALSLVFGVKKFHQYLYLNNFTLVTDHKPLISIFGSKGGLPEMTANRLQRYALFLANYQYDIQFVSGKANTCADFLSRLPLRESMEDQTCEASNSVQLNYVATGTLPIDCKEIIKATTEDPILSKVIKLTRLGWPDKGAELPESIMPFYQRKEQLSFESGCLFWGYRLVVPNKCRTKVVQTLHEGHLGMVKMKSVARAYIWWPNIDVEIERTVTNCNSCQAERYNPPDTKGIQWNQANCIWERLHLDFLGPFQGKLYLVCTDSFSKWVEVLPVPSTSTESTISALLPIFARFGLPIHVVADNGPPFSSHAFRFFLSEYGVKLTLIPPYHPKSNGLAENSVKYFKHKLKTTMHDQDFNIHTAMFKILFNYRNSVHCSTNKIPAVVIFGRKLRTKLDLLLPISGAVVCKLPITNQPKFKIGDRVLAKNYREGNQWLPAVVVQELSPVTYHVRLNTTGVIWKRHTDQLLRNERADITSEIQEDEEEGGNANEVSAASSEREEEAEKLTTEYTESGDIGGVCKERQEVPGAQDSSDIHKEKEAQPKEERRYPLRDRKPPNKLDL